jgi:hypothetical protein
LQGPWLQCQFARVVKGLDLRSNAGNCAWVRTPQLAHSLLPSGGLVFRVIAAICEAHRLYSSVVERQSCKLKVLGSIPSGGCYFAPAVLCSRVSYCWCRSCGGALCLAQGIWRNGSASDSRSEGWEFESLCPHFVRPRWVGLRLGHTRSAVARVYTRGGTRTHNLLLRGEAPYPLGHTGVCL